MAGASSDGEVNHWPAFVDVLTTVIMVVTFLLVIMSSAVMMLSQRVIKQIELKAAQAGHPIAATAKSAAAGTAAGATAAAVPAHGNAGQQSPVRSPQVAPDGTAVSELGAVLKIDSPVNGDERLSIRTRDTPETLKLAVKATEVPKEDKGVAVTVAATLLKISFEPKALNYDDATAKKVIDFLHAHSNPGASYEVWSFVPQTGSVSEAQRVAFYRAALTRNMLVKAGVSTKQIQTQIRITDPKLPDGHNVRVVLKP